MIYKADHKQLTVARQLQALQEAAYAVESALIDYPDLPPLNESVADIQQSSDVFLVCQKDSRLVGALSYEQVEDVLDITRLVIHPDYFRQGIAGQLLRQVEQLAVGIVEITVSTAIKNKPAIALYKKYGYEQKDMTTLPDGLVLVHLRKQLKFPLDIDVMMGQIETAVAPYPKAALFELAQAGFNTPFQILVACIISIRTRDEVTLPLSQQLLAQAPTPADICRLTVKEVDHLIRHCTFHQRKAQQIHTIAQQVVDEFEGQLPCDRALLLSFSGVGPKCANLALGIACQQPFISVDVHVHRITNRWGYVTTKTPEKTMVALEKTLPSSYWIDINRLLVPLGKHICTGQRPRCTICPVKMMCRQVEVTAWR